ncbi:CinA family protein [bacterium]|nr:CinA family protein [bacterium]MBU1433676.1 CinA family protein [bacterium]MBU1503751.1 CinA family protein [bacterium]
MKLHLLLIGNKFSYNTPLKEYILRKVEQKSGFIDSITFFKEGDNSLFLYLQQELNETSKIIIITTKQNFSTVGKLISTVTGDNQILKENMLIPSNATVFEDGSYLLEYKHSIANVLHLDEMQDMPEILISNTHSNAIIHIFEEDKESAIAMLTPIAQMYDISLDIVNLIDGWLRVDVSSSKYGNISKFIQAAKQLLPHKLIAASNIILYIIEVLSKNQKKVTFAESCTGGLLSYYFTSQNGASKILDGSLITYSNELKENWLGIDDAVINTHGAVSFEVVQEMSEGAMNVSHADYALSISGIAGDTGGTQAKPIGTVYIGVRSQTEHSEVHLQLRGDRNYIQYQSVLYAVKMLLQIDREIFF